MFNNTIPNYNNKNKNNTPKNTANTPTKNTANNSLNNNSFTNNSFTNNNLNNSFTNNNLNNQVNINNEELEKNIKEEIMREVNIKINKNKNNIYNFLNNEIDKHKSLILEKILQNDYLKNLINEPLKVIDIIKKTSKFTIYIRNFIILFSIFNHVFRVLFGYFPLNAFVYLFIYNILLMITILSFSINYIMIQFVSNYNKFIKNKNNNKLNERIKKKNNQNNNFLRYSLVIILLYIFVGPWYYNVERIKYTSLLDISVKNYDKIIMIVGIALIFIYLGLNPFSEIQKITFPTLHHSF